MRPSFLISCVTLLAGCSAPAHIDLPLVSRESAFAPVEGLESTDLQRRTQGAYLSARGDASIEVTSLPSGVRRDHAIRGQIVALAGPAQGGRFVYAVRDDRAGLSIHRADLGGSDRPVLRYARAISAMSLAPDGERVAILSPFDEGDARSRGGVLRRLEIVTLATGAVCESEFACRNSTPAWIDAVRVACIAPRERPMPGGASIDVPGSDDDASSATEPRVDGLAWSVEVVDAISPAGATPLTWGESALADPAHESLLVTRRDERGDIALWRVPLGGGEGRLLKLRGALQPLALVGSDILVAFSLPTLGSEPQWELDLFGPQIALATIKLHDLATGEFQTIEPRASPRRIWSAGATSARP